MAQARMATYPLVVPAKKIVIGSRVVNQENEDLGQIEDVVIDAGVGRITYAVLSFGGFLGMEDKYSPIPWQALKFMATARCAVLNIDKKLLENATGFDKEHWPDMAESTWGNQIFRHYGYLPYWEEPPTGSTRDRF